MRIALILLLALGVGAAFAADEGGQAPSHDDHSTAQVESPRETIPHPQGSADTTWAGALVIIIIGLFVAAAAVGVVVRANMPDEPPQPDAHHDDHGSHDVHSGSSSHH